MVASTPMFWWQEPGPRLSPSSVPSHADQGDVGLAVAAVDGEHRGGHDSHAQVVAVGVEQQVGQPGRDVVLADQRVREQGAVHAVAPAVDRGVERELLVRRHVRDQSGEQRVERLDRLGGHPCAADPGGHLDHALSSRNGRRAVVAEVDHLHVAAVGHQRGDQVDRGLGVVGAAALLEQRRLLVQRRVGVQVEQLPLDRGDLCGPGRGGLLLGDHGVVRVEVPQVVGRQDPEPAQEVQRQSGRRQRARTRARAGRAGRRRRRQAPGGSR